MRGSGTEFSTPSGVDVVELRLEGIVHEIGTDARRWTSAKKKRAIEMLLVEWVDGKPYSR